jgi:hypothetical protein
MTNLIVIAFNDQFKAEEVRIKLRMMAPNVGASANIDADFHCFRKQSRSAPRLVNEG